MELQDVQGRLEVGLRLRQLHLDGPQTVDVGRRQVHSQQRQVDLEGRSLAVCDWLGVAASQFLRQQRGHQIRNQTCDLHLYSLPPSCCNVGDSICGAHRKS